MRLGGASPLLGTAPVYRCGGDAAAAALVQLRLPLVPLPACARQSTTTPALSALSPSYGRPSNVPKGKAAVPVATDGKVGPSTLESKAAVLERLHMSENSQEVGGGAAV